MQLNIDVVRWVIMDKKRRVIAKGIPRHRWLIRLDDFKDKKQILFYDTRKKDEAAFTDYGFYGNFDPEKKSKNEHGFDVFGQYDLEAVRVRMVIKEEEEGVFEVLKNLDVLDCWASQGQVLGEEG